jgi:hypothetical protein
LWAEKGSVVFTNPQQPPSAQWLNEQADAIRALAKDVIGGIMGIGSRLREVEVALPYGQLEKWLDAEFRWASRTARRYMAVSGAFAFTSDTVSELPFDVTALQLLTRPKVPEAARAEAIERAKQGEHITTATARAIANSYLSVPVTTPPPKSRTITVLEILPSPVEKTIEVQLLPTFSWPSLSSPSEIVRIMIESDRMKALVVARLVLELRGEDPG